jgi:hypothetical protein
MAVSPTGIIPEQLMWPNRLADVLDFIGHLHADSDQKVDLLRGWAQTVGVNLSASQFNSVRFTGTDRLGPLA